jgi:glycosyltransferase involved in cell wall biosynthesis
MAKLLFLNRLFGPETEVTGFLLNELAEDLAAQNEVTVICSDRARLRSEIWPLIRREKHGTVKVVRVFALKISKDRGLYRYLDHLIYFALAWFAAIGERPDAIVAETDPPVLGLLATVFKFVKRCRFIYYCQDIYPEVAVATGGLKNRAVLAVLRRCNDAAYGGADAIVALGSDMAGLLRRKHIPLEKIAVIPNWADCDKIHPQESAANRQGKLASFVVMYAGNLGWTQNLEVVLEAALLLRHEPRVKFVLVGDGARKKHLEAVATVKRLVNVEFIDRVLPSAMSDLLATGDLHLIPLGAGVAGSMVPSKVYGILAAGRPFVAMMEDYAEVARLAVTSEVGFVVPPGDSAALARTITEAMSNPKRLEAMGHRARLLAEQSYDRHLITARFARLVEAVLADNSLQIEGEITPVPETEALLPTSPR